MREQIVVKEYTVEHEGSGAYKIQFVAPAAAQVSLVTFTSMPEEVMAMLVHAYTGDYTGEFLDEDTRNLMIKDIQRTKLQTPMEMIHMVWLLRDVTRAFTHQLVRYRVGTSFVQESMRFFGTHGVYKVLVTGRAANDDYFEGAVTAIKNYHSMVFSGVPSEDARGILPTNILTNIYFDCSLRTLQGIFPQRLCCQAQPGEWQPILREMRQIIGEKMGAAIEQTLRAPYELGQPCGYRASFDRPCTWQKQ